MDILSVYMDTNIRFLFIKLLEQIINIRIFSKLEGERSQAVLHQLLETAGSGVYDAEANNSTEFACQRL